MTVIAILFFVAVTIGGIIRALDMPAEETPEWKMKSDS